MGKPTVTISLETLETIYDIYLESDDLVGAAESTIAAVQEVEQLLGVDPVIVTRA